MEFLIKCLQNRNYFIYLQSTREIRLTVRTRDSHSLNRSSILLSPTKIKKEGQGKPDLLFYKFRKRRPNVQLLIIFVKQSNGFHSAEELFEKVAFVRGVDSISFKPKAH